MKKQFYIILFSLFIAIASIAQEDATVDPPEVKAYKAGIAKFEEGKYRDALISLTQAINSGYKDKDAVVKRGVAYYQTKQYAKAQDDFNDAVKGRINTAELYEYRGKTKYQLKDYQGAGVDLRRRCVGDPG